LFIMGTILDDITACTNTIRASGPNWMPMLFFFIVFVLLSSFTMLNMLIGILCEVVVATGEGERNRSSQESVREAIVDLFQSIDKDSSGEISKDEFMSMRNNDRVMKALKELEIKAKHFEMYAALLFKQEEESGASPTFDFEKTINLIMRLRPGTKVSALDFASFQMTVYRNHDNLKKHISGIEKMTTSLTGQEFPASRRSSSKNRQGSRMKTKPDLQSGEEPPTKIMANTIPTLEKSSDQDILFELQRRLGRNSLGAAGGPNSAINPSKVVEAFETFNVPQPLFDTTEAWSKETYTC